MKRISIEITVQEGIRNPVTLGMNCLLQYLDQLSMGFESGVIQDEKKYNLEETIDRAGCTVSIQIGDPE